MPNEVGWRQILGAGALAGIGFTMSLFVANLAFGPTPTLETAKVGILAASVAAGAAGTFILSKTNTGDIARAKRVSRQKGDRS
jgi:NhaA family Na+:H+ antiporter